MDTKQPNALRLADALGRAPKWQQLQAAAKLRRQHAEIDTLRTGYDAARLEIESLQARIQELGQQARECSDRKVVQLESALARHVRSGKDWAMRVEALERTITTLRAHIASSNAQAAAAKKAMRELEAQVDAVGAGGVEPLRKSNSVEFDGIKSPSSVAPIMQLAAPVRWPKNAAEVREFFRSDFIQAEFAAENHNPCDEDRYYISAHDFLSAINWWADFPNDDPSDECLHQIAEPDHFRGATQMVPPDHQALTDTQMHKEFAALRERIFDARIGRACSRCEGGTYQADNNGYSQFHRCNKCHYVPMWGEDGREFGATAAPKGGAHGQPT